MTENYGDLTLAHLRRELCQARMALRDMDGQVPFRRAEAEGRIINSFGGDEKVLGTNEAARQRNMLLHLHADASYTDSTEIRRLQQNEVAKLETELDIRLDQRRDYQYAVLECLSAALGVPTTGTDAVAEAPESIAAEYLGKTAGPTTIELTPEASPALTPSGEAESHVLVEGGQTDSV